MESYSLIKYKYQTGTYDIKKMLLLVQQHIITQEDFKNITCFNYKGYLQNQKKGVH